MKNRGGNAQSIQALAERMAGVEEPGVVVISSNRREARSVPLSRRAVNTAMRVVGSFE
jgi:hypothetical protein